MSVLKKKKERF